MIKRILKIVMVVVCISSFTGCMRDNNDFLSHAIDLQIQVDSETLEPHEANVYDGVLLSINNLSNNEIRFPPDMNSTIFVQDPGNDSWIEIGNRITYLGADLILYPKNDKEYYLEEVEFWPDIPPEYQDEESVMIRIEISGVMHNKRGDVLGNVYADIDVNMLLE